MSDVILPQAQRLIFCREYIVDPVVPDVSLKGLINRLRFHSFPTPIVPFTVYSVLEGGVGEGEMRVTVYEGGEEGLRFLHRRSVWLHFLGEPSMIELVMPLKKLQFLAPVTHTVVLTFDGVVVAKRTLPVEKST